MLHTLNTTVLHLLVELRTSPDAQITNEMTMRIFGSGSDLFFRIKGLDKENGF